MKNKRTTPWPPALVNILYRAMLMMVFLIIPLCAEWQTCRAEESPVALSVADSLAKSREITVTLTKLENGVTDMKSRVFIKARANEIWNVLTDYNNLYRYIPRMTASVLLEENEEWKVVALTGRIGFLFFKKTIQLAMKMYAEYPRKVSFEKISGDFEVYRGFWMLEEAASAKGTKLTYEIEIKPSFSVPSFIFQSMLKKDIQSGLTTVRSAAEELPASLPGSENKNPSASLK